MVDAILSNRHLVVPASVYLEGEYGQSGIFFGVPAQLGSKGLEKIIEYDLNDEEQAALEASAKHVKETIEELEARLQVPA
jgi:malate dehydrogenase